jgi:hypothetical protein
MFLHYFFFFLNAIPVFCHTAFTVPFRPAVFPFQFFFLPPFRWCDGAPGHFPRPPTPIPPHIHRHTQHLYTHGRFFPTGLEPVLISRWWSKECVALPSTTLPSAPNRHTHNSMAWRRFLPSKKSSPFGGIRTH